MATTKLWTAEDVAGLPDDSFRYALIKGVLYRMPPPMSRHGRVVMAVGAPIYVYALQNRLGAVYDQSGFIFERDPDTLLSPDLAFVQRANIPVDPNSYPRVAPDLVVEVASPSQSGPSIEQKVATYLAAGVRLIWVVDPEPRTVHVYRGDGTERVLTDEDVIDGEDVLPGFRLPVARLFD